MALLKDKFSGDNPPIGYPGGMALRQAKFKGNRYLDNTNIGTWNVRGLLQTGKTYIMEKELERYNMDITGISETHWKGNGLITTANGNTIVFSGNTNNSRNGVAIIMTSSIAKTLMGYNAINDRMISIKIHSKPVNLNIIQVYAPTSDSNVEEIEQFYGELETILQKIPNREITIIVGDFNAKVGDTKDDNHLRHIVGKYGIGTRNERGEMLLNFCAGNGLTIMNTVHQQHIRRVYTWQSPGDRCRNQIDYILIRTRWRTSIRNTKTLPGAECGSDHKLLTARFKLKLKVPQRRTTSPRTQISDEKIFEEKLQTKLDNPPTQQETLTPEEIWQFTKLAINETIKETKKKQIIEKRQHWITDQTMEIVQERRDLRASGIDTEQKRIKYTALSKTIQRCCRKDKNTHLLRICNEAQGHAENNNTKDLYKLVKTINKKYTPRSWTIENKEGEKITNIDETLEVWKEYCEELFNDQERTDTYTQEDMEEEPTILKEEIRDAIKKLKPLKSPGADNITTEIIKAMGESGVHILHKICNGIWSTGQWPDDWVESVFIPLHKKGSKEKCENYRLIALMSHASKILLKIMNERLKPFLLWQIPPQQAGFMKGRGTREQISNIRRIIEKAREINKPIYMCFVDYRKAFDSMKWEKLWTILREMGVPHHLRTLIQQLYKKSKARVRIDKHLSNPCNIKKGARQGCILSPILFNIYTEYIMRRVLENWNGGISIGGTTINNLRYADDTVLLTSTAEELAELVQKLKIESESFDLKINMSKTKIMIIDRANNNNTDITHIDGYEVVSQYIYLGALITNDGACTKEINRRCEMARQTVRELQKTWMDSDITLNTKKQIIKTLVFPVLLYGSESWTIKKQDRRKIDACELWCWRRILRVPWTAHRTNISINNEINEAQRLSQIVLARILKFFGHINRRDDNNLEKLVIQGKMEGKRPRGRSPMRWTDTIKATTNSTITQATRESRNRERWRDIVRRTTAKE